jgi:hypothetical protein
MVLILTAVDTSQFHPFMFLEYHLFQIQLMLLSLSFVQVIREMRVHKDLKDHRVHKVLRDHKVLKA